VRRTSRMPAEVMTVSIGQTPGNDVRVRLVTVGRLCFTGRMDEDVRDDYFARLRTRLGEDYRLLRAAISAADPEAKVPSCPDWTASELAHHVAQTYLHKVECIRNSAFPEDWPPSDLNPDPVGVLEEAYAALAAVFEEHGPGDPAATWHAPDQTVGFWIRRMCQETVVHRVDAEQVAGLELAPIPADVALDGADEFLELFIGYLSTDWPEHFGEILARPDPRPILISGGARSWTLEVRPEGVAVRPAMAVPGIEEDEEATWIEGEPDALLLWLWGRVGDRSVRRKGDAALLEQFLALRRKATQ
jgi:uncharacterized protein (TIGR03083 family)